MVTLDTLFGPLARAELALIDAYWRAANHLSVGQIYLMDNPLLLAPLVTGHSLDIYPEGSASRPPDVGAIVIGGGGLAPDLTRRSDEGTFDSAGGDSRHRPPADLCSKIQAVG